MTKLTLACVLAGISIASLATMTLRASAQEENTAINFRGKVNWAWETKPATAIRVVDPNPAGRVVIYSNFGPNNGLYESNVAWDVAGPDSSFGPQWVAMPFTPTFDAAVTKIAVAVEHQSGPNSFVLSLNADNGGQLPGKVLHSWNVANAPEFGTCCTLDMAKDSAETILHKGTEYWIVAATNEDEERTHMQWDLSPQGLESSFAFNNGQGWGEFTAFPSAFGVYGIEIH